MVITDEMISLEIMKALDAEWVITETERVELTEKGRCFKELLTFSELQFNALLIDVCFALDSNVDYDTAIELSRNDKVDINKIIEVVRTTL